MLGLILAGLLIAAPETGEPPQTTPAPESEPAIRLEDVAVTGRPLSSLIERFVGEVAAPNPDRGLARWRSGVCVGVANLRNEAAQYLVDRVSTVAADLGLRAGHPGCSPNLLIIAADEPDRVSEELVTRHRGALRMGGSGMDRGGTALRAFQTSDRPVRWWQVSMPVDNQTGERATRISGECDRDCGAASVGGSSYRFAPNINIFAASRLSTQIVDDIFRTIVVVDVNQLSRVNIEQLADYIAMVSLAQIDPAADTSRYASILNVFADPEGAEGLTDWDKAYLTGLYDTNRTRLDRRASRLEIASSIERAHKELRGASPGED